MIDLQKCIDRIQSLVNDDTVQSLTYAALECRLTIEVLCYERVRMSFDYLPYNELKKWQPRDVMKQVVAEANELADQEIKISIATDASSEAPPQTAEDFQKLNYAELGTQSGLNLNKLGRLWNSLSGVALHVSLPDEKHEEISPYGTERKIRKKIVETLTEFEKINSGTIILGGSGAPTNEVHRFECVVCNTEIRKNISLLKERTIANCPAPSCMESYLITKTENDLETLRLYESVTCQSCGDENQVPRRYVARFYFGQTLHVGCHNCSFDNEVVLKPHVKKISLQSEKA